MEDFINRWFYDPVIGKIIPALIALLIVVAFVRILHRLPGRFIQDSSARYRARKIITFWGYIMAIIVLITIFTDKLGGLHVALGVAGAGVAFSLQEVIMSTAGWSAITFANFYKTGDRIQLGAIKGDVINIGIIRTTLMEIGQWVNGDLYNGRVVRMANSFVFKEPVFNYSSYFPFLWDEITLPIKYGSDYLFAKEIIFKTARDLLIEYAKDAEKSWEKIVDKFMIENANVEPPVTIEANENWMTFTIRYVVDYKKRRSTKTQLFVAILKAIENSEGKVNIASTSMEINPAKAQLKDSDEIH